MSCSRLAIERGQPVEAETLAREVLDRYLREQNPTSQAIAVRGDRPGLSGAAEDSRGARRHRAFVGARRRKRPDQAVGRHDAGAGARPARAPRGHQATASGDRSSATQRSRATRARSPVGARGRRDRSGTRQIARLHLASLERDAARHGFGLIARKARRGARRVGRRRDPRTAAGRARNMKEKETLGARLKEAIERAFTDGPDEQTAQRAGEEPPDRMSERLR